MRATIISAFCFGALAICSLSLSSGCGDINLSNLSDLFGQLDPNSVGDPNDADPNDN